MKLLQICWKKVIEIIIVVLNAVSNLIKDKKGQSNGTDI